VGALARIGGPRVIDAVLELIKDKDENIRRSAIEILCTCRDKRAVDRLIEATKDQDWWVSERAADALGEIGDAKALPALIEMVGRNNRSLPVALRAVGKVGTFKILDQILPYLQRPEKDVRVAAIEAVAQLAGEQQADSVKPYIQQAAAGAEETAPVSKKPCGSSPSSRCLPPRIGGANSGIFPSSSRPSAKAG